MSRNEMKLSCDKEDTDQLHNLNKLDFLFND